MNWSNTSWEPPKEPYAWRCFVCEKSNAAGTQSCSTCGCPDQANGRELIERQRQYAFGQPYDGRYVTKPVSRDPKRRLDGSNKLPWLDLFRFPFFTLALGYAIFTLFKDGKSRVFFSRKDPGVMITDAWALFFVAAGYVLLLVYFVSQLVDHFDRRKNEELYKKLARMSLGTGFPCLLIGVLIQSLR
jgi:hypothetical protein